MINYINIIYIILVISIKTVTVNANLSLVDLLRLHSQISEDGRLDFLGLATKYGHPAKTHYVITEDGYNLTLFRIPGDIEKPVLLIHGDTVDADCFILRGNTSLAITLAGKGYDVWIIALRGTIYSQRHLSLDPVENSTKFFDFDFYEKGVYDVPATIDYILKDINRTELLVIGYSAGNTAALTMAAEIPEYNDKIKAFISLAAFVYTQHQRELADMELDYISRFILSVSDVSEVLGRNQIGTVLFQAFCLYPANYFICVRALVFGLYGADQRNFEPEFTRTFFGHFPSGSTKKQLLHIQQMDETGELIKFDYGGLQNLRVYGNLKPPKIDLSKVTMKVALFSGLGDNLSTAKDIERLANELPNVVHHQALPNENFNHFDFVYARYMSKDLYPHLMGIVEKYI